MKMSKNAKTTVLTLDGAAHMIDLPAHVGDGKRFMQINNPGVQTLYYKTIDVLPTGTDWTTYLAAIAFPSVPGTFVDGQTIQAKDATPIIEISNTCDHVVYISKAADANNNGYLNVGDAE